MNKTNYIFRILFISIGIFALVGGLCTWGEGSIFEQSELIKVLIPWADILVTSPLSVMAGYGILKDRNWGQLLGLSISGIYVFGSVLVFVCVVWSHNYDFCLIIPASFGFIIGFVYVFMILVDKISISLSAFEKQYDHAFSNL